YAVGAGRRVTDAWAIDGFDRGVYHLCVCGPNGFLRELTGNSDDPLADIHCEYVRKPEGPTGDLQVTVVNRERDRTCRFESADHAYGYGRQSAEVKPGTEKTVVLRLAKSHSWYDFTVKIAGSEAFARRCAGRVETGKAGYSDPAMGRTT